MVGGNFKSLTKDNNNVVTYENLVAKKNDYVVFLDGAYNPLEVTFASSIDNTVCHKMDISGMSMIYFDKAGTFDFYINKTTLVLRIEK